MFNTRWCLVHPVIARPQVENIGKGESTEEDDPGERHHSMCRGADHRRVQASTAGDTEQMPFTDPQRSHLGHRGRLRSGDATVARCIQVANREQRRQRQQCLVNTPSVLHERF